MKEIMIGKYLILVITFGILGFLFGKFITKPGYKIQKNIISFTPFKKYHVHHSFYGLLFILIGFLFQILWIKIVLISFGAGLFVEHSLGDGFKIITKY